MGFFYLLTIFLLYVIAVFIFVLLIIADSALLWRLSIILLGNFNILIFILQTCFELLPMLRETFFCRIYCRLCTYRLVECSNAMDFSSCKVYKLMSYLPWRSTLTFGHGIAQAATELVNAMINVALERLKYIFVDCRELRWSICSSFISHLAVAYLL